MDKNKTLYIFPFEASSNFISIDHISQKINWDFLLSYFDFNLLIEWQSLLWILVITGICFAYWNTFYRPFDLYKDFSDLGFEGVTKKRGDTIRKDIINGLRKRRKIGDLPPAYPNGWFSILESDQLKKGEVAEVEALGQNLVAWRGESGQAYASDAYCPHLGAHLGVGGTVTGECITCPFHSWSFDGKCKGKLTSVPYSDSPVPEFVKLKMWRTYEANGFVFIWYHAEREDPTWFPEPIPEIKEGKWSYKGRHEFKVSCHIQELPENGADFAHMNVLHKPAVFCGDCPDNSTFSWSFIQHVLEAKWSVNSDPKRSHEAIIEMAHFMTLFGKIPFFHLDMEVRQIGPGIVVMYFDTLFGKGVLYQTVTPVEPLLQKMTHRFYSCPTMIQPIGRFILQGEATQIARDVRVWNRKCFNNKPILVKEDHPIKTFRRWYSQFYSENSPRHYFSKLDDDSKSKSLQF